MNKKVLHSVIDNASEVFKERIAIDEVTRTITYEALRDYSNRIGHTLVKSGVGRGVVVAVYLQTGIDYVSSILGVNKAGGMFMPLELSYPVKRLTYLLEKASPRIVITKTTHVENLLEIFKGSSNTSLDTIVVVPEQGDSIEILTIKGGEIKDRKTGSSNVESVDVEVDGDDSNYLIYTSGSTGQPKIIEGCHKSLSHFMHWEKTEFSLDENVRVSQLAPLSFDASFRDMFLPLICGGCLFIPDPAFKGNIVSLIKWIGEKKINILHTVPSLFKQLTRTLQENESLRAGVSSVKHILLAGEALYGKDVIEWRDVAGEDAAEIVNLYGPSETTLVKTYNRIGASIGDPKAIVSIGKPISNSFIIIARKNRLCEVGDIGDIYIKTPFRTKGYYNDEVQTSERFIQNPLHNDYADIVYYTGDLGRYTNDRSVQFEGRQDSQVKIRGNRVELFEVEKVLMRYDGVHEVAVLTIKDNDDEVLACYFVERTPIDESGLRSYVQDYLPEYMHPSYYIRLEKFPLNSNGKIDKKQLPRPEGMVRRDIPYEKTSTVTEEKLEKIWKEVLKIDLVGRKASFFQLGGTSLKAIQIISRIYKEFNTLIAIGDIFTHPIIAELAFVVERSIRLAYKQVPVVGEQDNYELSHAQKALWIQHQVSGSLAYHMLGGCYLHDLDKAAFEKTFKMLVERHESLRTSFINIAGEPRLKIHAPNEFNFQLAYYTITSIDDEQREVARHIHAEATTPFNLETGPLIRSRLIQGEGDKHLFLFNMHHIISDGWSGRVLAKELLALYDAYRKGQENPMSPLRIQYKDYAAWQNNLIRDSANKHHRSYWHEKLSGEIPVLNLPVDFKRKATRTYEGARHLITLSKEQSELIRDFCKAKESTLFMFFLALVNIELYKLTDEKDIVVGSPIAGRSHADLENQIGLYLNNIILRNAINGTHSFKEFLLTVKKCTLEAYDYQEYPYDRLVEELKPSTPPGRNPFYDVILVMSNSLLSEVGNEMDQWSEVLKASDLGIENKTSKLDMSFFVTDDPAISIIVEYSTELFKKESILKIEEDLHAIIDKVLVNEELRLGDISRELSGADTANIHEIAIQETTETLLHSLVDKQSEVHEHTIAIEENGRAIRYGLLKNYSNRIAHTLMNEGVDIGTTVGVYLKSGIDYVGSILGVNKAGGVFMPLELSYPVKRMQYLLSKASPRIIITSEAYLEDLLRLYEGVENAALLERIILVSGEHKPIELVNVSLVNVSEGTVNDKRQGSDDEGAVSVVLNGDHSNYLIYTSGSTGQPKMIEGSHKSLSHFMRWEREEFRLDETVRVSQLAPLSFDASFRDIFVPLTSGGCVYIPDQETKGNIISLLKWMGEKRITVLHTVPSLFRQLTRTLKENASLVVEVSPLKHILLAGEPLYGRDVLQWREVAGEGTEIINLYGPSETTLIKTYHRIGEVTDIHGMLTVGKPISSTAILIISDGELCSVGSSGEIHIKTPFRSKGYYKDEAQTKERFIQNPLNKTGEDIVYKTGDIGRYQKDGSIEFVGRQDSQVKISGNRVELSEVERAVKGYAGVDEVVVTTLKDDDGDRIACYFTCDGSVEESGLREYVKGYLPEYMHPSYYVKLEEFPLNINGKIDKRSLPVPEAKLREEIAYEKPITVTEEKLEQIWRQVLKVELIGRNASFFQLGGTSLKAIQLISRIYKEFNTLVTIADVFSSPTIAGLSTVVEKSIRSAYKDIPLVAEQDSYEVSPSQKGLWIQHQVSGSLAYHMLGGCYLHDLDREAFDKAFETLVERHESLRTYFINISGEPRQKIQSAPEVNFRVEYYDIRSSVHQKHDVAHHVNIELTNAFDLEHAPLIRSRLLQLEDDKYLFLFNMHHIISDGWSMAVLVKEILSLYEAYRKKEQNPLSPLRIQYKDYAAWQNKLISDSTTQQHRSYWHEKLSGNLSILNLPVDYTRPEVRTYEGKKYLITLDLNTSDEIRKICNATGSSLFMFFLAVLNLELYHLTDEKDIIIGSPVAGRNHIDLENQIGLYLNYLILRNSINRTASFKEFLSSIKQSTLEAYDYQEYPYDRLVEELKPVTHAGRNPFYDVMLVMNNSLSVDGQNTNEQSGESLQASDFSVERTTSKLDLSLFVNDNPEISISVEYSTELFKEETIVNLEKSIRHILKLIGTSIEISVGDIAWELSGMDKEELLGSTIDEISENF